MTDEQIINVSYRAGTQNVTKAVPMPDTCPICKCYSQIKFVTAKAVHESSGTAINSKFLGIDVVGACEKPTCGRLFIARFNVLPSGGFRRAVVFPKHTSHTEFDEEIERLSPEFIAIFKQAESAEVSGLDLIAGPGFRKAAEFFIKDYAISKQPEKEDEIQKMFVGKVVEEFMDDARIKRVAKRAFWLGNDEAHYLRKWEDKDIKDLKTLIELTAHYILMEHLSDGYENDMPEGS